jgi:hypothetical protein
MNSLIVLSLSSKCLSFRSLYKHHKKPEGTIFHTTALRERPHVHQQANKFITRKGITQDRLKRLRIAFHRVRATLQWRRSWSTDSPFILHKHLSNTMTCIFLRLSNVRVFPSAVDQAKKATFNGTFVCQILFQGKWTTSLQARTL